MRFIKQFTFIILTLIILLSPMGDFSAAQAEEQVFKREQPAEMPTIRLMYNSDPENKAVMEMIADMWREKLGLNVILESEEWFGMQKSLQNSDYEICRYGFMSDVDSPLQILSMFKSDNQYNYPLYQNDAYDKLILSAMNSGDDIEGQYETLHAAAQHIIDDMPVIPIYFYQNMFLSNNRISGYRHDAFTGQLIFTHASSKSGNINCQSIDLPETLDPQFNASSLGAGIISHIFSGLTRRNANGNIQPELAASWEVSQDKLTWTFELNGDARWSDKTKITAGDFIDAWQRALDPTADSAYASLLYIIKNAQLIKLGDAAPDELGASVDKKGRLVVTLEEPCPYFDQLVSLPVFFPVPAKAYEALDGDWSVEAEGFISSGPMALSAFDEGEKLTLTRNKNYYKAADIEKITLNYIPIGDPAAALEAFENGDVDFTFIFPKAQLERLRSEADYLKVEPLAGLYALYINTTASEFLDDVNVRRALALAIDRDKITHLLQNDSRAAYSLVPYAIRDSNTRRNFTRQFTPLFGNEDYDADCSAARALLEKSGYLTGR